MHTLEEIRRELKRLDTITGVDSSGISISFSERMTNTYGNCRCVRAADGRYQPEKITIAAFLRQEDVPFWNTVRHEYAHAVAVLRTGQKPGHDRVWREICREVGAPEARLAPDCESHLARNAGQFRYLIICNGCGAFFHRQRCSKFVRAVQRAKRGVCSYRCACGSREFTLQKLK